MTEILLAIAVVLVAFAIVLSRDETTLVRTWSQLVSRKAAEFRSSVGFQVKAKEYVAKTRRSSAANAAGSGSVLEAARLEGLASEAEQEHRTLRLLQRMLSALR